MPRSSGDEVELGRSTIVRCMPIGEEDALTVPGSRGTLTGMLLRFAPATFLLFSALPVFGQTTWFVDLSASGPGTGTSQDPYASIVQAITAPTTVNGDTVEVAPGTYLESFHLAGKSLRVQGGPGPRPIIRGDGVNRYLDITGGGGSETEIIGFTFFAGTGGINSGEGGAVYVEDSTAAFRDCLFDTCRACENGGALLAYNSDLIFTECEFRNNIALRGGAIWIGGGSVTFGDCVFTDNRLEDGVGCGNNQGNGGALVLNQSQATIQGCTFERNTQAVSGGAIWLGSSGGSTIQQCYFEDNRAGRGGATTAPGATILECTFIGNSSFSRGGAGAEGRYEFCYFSGNSSAYGGALYSANVVDSVLVNNHAVEGSNQSEGGATHSCQPLRCLIARNTCVSGAGGVANGSVNRCTVIDNIGFPTFAGVEGTANNSIVWGNRSVWPGLPVIQVGLASYSTFSIIEGDPSSVPGPPLVHDRDLSDGHLLAGSPAIDAASPTLPLDPDGSRADIGALPFESSYRISAGRYCEAKVTSEGCVPAAHLVGQISASAADARIDVSGVPSGGAALLVASTESGVTQGFFGGTLCLGGTLIRGDVAIPLPASGCGSVVTFPVGSAFAGQLGAQPGDAVHLQVWFRDTAQSDGTGVGLSDAIVTTVLP